jgi:hypothetical protein
VGYLVKQNFKHFVVLHLKSLFDRSEQVLVPQPGAEPTYCLFRTILITLYNGYLLKKRDDNKLHPEKFDYNYLLYARNFVQDVLATHGHLHVAELDTVSYRADVDEHLINLSY